MKIPDLWLFIPVVLISVLGLIITFSISPGHFISQLMFILVGIVLLIVITNIDYQILIALSPFFYGLVLLALLATLLVGTITRGSNRWLPIGGMRLQASEFAKSALILFISFLSTKLNLHKFPHFLLVLLAVLIPALFIFVQPDLGSTIMLTLIGGYCLLTINKKKRFILSQVLLVVLILPLIWSNLAAYQKERVLNFLNPQSDPLGANYNQIQAVIAAGSGQVFGKGLGKGTQSHLQYLPEKHTDFFFASLSEEFGFLGSSLVIILFGILLGRLITLANNSQTTEQKVIFLGSFILFFSQVVVHIGINIGILPVTGLTLPLMSVGGSSMIASFIVLGISCSTALQLKQNRAIFLR